MTRTKIQDVGAADTNIVVIVGEVVSPPVVLATSGPAIVTFDVRTRRSGANATVTIRANAEGLPAELAAGLRVGVIGTVARRFFVAGGRTQTRTDVQADEVVAATAARARKLRARGAQRLIV